VVPYKESFADTMQDILGGLRASMSLVGARNIKDMSKCTTFIRVNNQINTVFGS
jgi:GMP reductase